MNPVNAHDVLNRLLIIHKRSLPSYLAYAHPFRAAGDEGAAAVLRQIAADHRATVDRLGEMILESGGVAASGEFPMPFTGWHDLSYEFLLGKMTQLQKGIVTTIEECVSQLEGHVEAKAVAEEALGQARAHLDMLEEQSMAAG